MKKIYLACPYTSPDLSTRRDRVELASLVAARLMEAGHVVFSPVTHGHAVADHLPPDKARDHRFWMQQCLPLLEACDELMVLPLAGWRESHGVTEEWAFALAHNIPMTVWQNFNEAFETLYPDELQALNLLPYQGAL